MFCNIWVRDTFDNRVHQVGTEQHDSLMMLDGVIHYENLQNGGGTFDNSYEFVEQPEGETYVVVTPDILRVNRDLIHGDLLKKLEEEDNKF